MMASQTESQSVKRIGLIAGEGKLPVHVARNAAEQGIDVVAFTIGWDNRHDLKQLCRGRIHSIVPGLLNRTLTLLKQESIQHLVFAGKVNKWILFRNPSLDERALRLLKAHKRKNDDKFMQVIIEELAKEGISVLSQSAYLKNLFLPAGILTDAPSLSEEDQEDIRYGFEIAKGMGGLDIGQTIVIRQGMILAVEAIEGTDECLRRAGKWARKKGGVVVKVAKPEQDHRFDVPTVGLRTPRVMKKCGLHLLATEANRTLFLEPEEMVRFANRHGITITSVEKSQWP
jgi:DUF1009 family protein